MYLTAVSRGGELATSDGGCVGLVPSIGRRAAISWHEAEAGVLCTGQNGSAVAATGLDLVTAAIQHRKSVIVIDLAGRTSYEDGGVGLAAWGPAGGGSRWTSAAARGAGSVASIERACADVGAPLRRFGWSSPGWDPDPGASMTGTPAEEGLSRRFGWSSPRSADTGPFAWMTRAPAESGPPRRFGRFSRAGRDHSRAGPIGRAGAAAGAPPRCSDGRDGRYEPFAGVDPARAAALVLAMIDWRGASHAQRQFCASYLNAALAVIAATTAGPPAKPVAVLDELAALLSPGALGARLRRVPGHLRGSDPLIGRAHDLAERLADDPELVSPVARQLAGLLSTELARWLRPAGAGGLAAPAGPAGAGNFARRPGWPRPGATAAPIELGQALADRQVVLFALDRRLHGRSAVMIARLVAADLTAALAERAALGAPADCLVWISGCEALDSQQLTALLAASAGTGTGVLLGTAAQATAIRLAADVNVVVVRGPAPPGLAALLGSPGPAWPARGPAASCPAGWTASPEPEPTGLSAMPEIGATWPAGILFETNGSTEVPAAELLGQRADELSLIVRGPQRRVLVRARAIR